MAKHHKTTEYVTSTEIRTNQSSHADTAKPLAETAETNTGTHTGDMSISGSKTPQQTPNHLRDGEEVPRAHEKIHTAFIVQFAGQGSAWLDTLADESIAHPHIARLVTKESEFVLKPVAHELQSCRPLGFHPVHWSDNPSEAPDDLADPAVSVPGIFIAQLATAAVVESYGIDLSSARQVIGHSQGQLGVQWLKYNHDTVELVAIAQLIGAAASKAARQAGLAATGTFTPGEIALDQVRDPRACNAALASIHSPLIQISGVQRRVVEAAFSEWARKYGKTDGGANQAAPHIALRNGRSSWVISASPSVQSQLAPILISHADQDEKTEQLTISQIDVRVGFHHPALESAVEMVVEWARQCSIDPGLAETCARAVLTDFVDWPAEVDTARRDLASQQADHTAYGLIIDVGSGRGMVESTRREVAGHRCIVIPAGTGDGHTALGNSDSPQFTRCLDRATDYTQFAPRVIELASHSHSDSQLALDTRFTRLTGRSPILLAGMTPTTVDPHIVAAAANGGHWVELAGGGQVTPEILEQNFETLTDLLDEGISAQFNALYLDPKLWGRHIGGAKLVQKARKKGQAIDGVVISAGIPETREAVELICELAEAGIHYVALKPGTLAQITSVLSIADELATASPDTYLIIQIEGGVAGGHHSWENLDKLLVASYDSIRRRPNTVVCAGGGIATPADAKRYLLGTWSHEWDLPTMPIDGVLIGTAAMATAESTASSSLKELLVSTPGSTRQPERGSVEGGITSSLSQLGADIHEIDNSWARAGRLLDSVAGDADAIEAQRDEIIAALERTAKPYFGDVENMTYRQWLERYAELSGPWRRSESVYGGWKDESWRVRFDSMVARAEARLSSVDEGEIPRSVLVRASDDTPEKVSAIIDELESVYPAIATDRVHPGDRAWFARLVDGPGKPANFVRAIDSDVRRRFRSDSLWQAHDERYDADAVSIIPGPAACAGITRVDEPVADLLDRMEQAAAVSMSESGQVETATRRLSRRSLSIDGVCSG